MLTPSEIKQRLEQVFEERQASALAEVFVDAYGALVKSSDFSELKAIVQELAEAQKRTEQRVGELVEAQKQSEQRISRLEVVVGELVEAQKRTEQRVGELAEAQKRTEQRVEELVEVQKQSEKGISRLDTVFAELAEVQKRTEEVLQRLALEHVETRRQLGGLAMTVGYTLENGAFKALPELLQRDFGIVVKDRLKRQYVTDNEGGAIEVNIIGEASGEGKEVVIVGEVKSQLSKNDADDFQRKKLNRLEGVFKVMFPVLVTHMTTGPDVEEYVKQKGMALYYSYDF